MPEDMTLQAMVMDGLAWAPFVKIHGGSIIVAGHDRTETVVGVANELSRFHVH